MRIVLLAVALLLSLASVAHAGWNEDQFARVARVDPGQLESVEGYQLLGARHFTHVVVGSYRGNKGPRNAVVLLRCDGKRCQGERVSLPDGDRFEVHRLVDLAGGSGPLLRPGVDRERARGGLADLGGARMRVPALVIEIHADHTADTRARRGASQRSELVVITLTPDDGSLDRQIFRAETASRDASGAGHSTSYRLDRSKSGGMLDIVQRRQPHLARSSRARQPAPVEVRYVRTESFYARESKCKGPFGC